MSALVGVPSVGHEDGGHIVHKYLSGAVFFHSRFLKCGTGLLGILGGGYIRNELGFSQSFVHSEMALGLVCDGSATNDHNMISNGATVLEVYSMVRISIKGRMISCSVVLEVKVGYIQWVTLVVPDGKLGMWLTAPVN